MLSAVSCVLCVGLIHRFEAYGWHTQVIPDGTNTSAIMEAIENAKKETGKPSIIKTKTIIGYGSQRQVRWRAACLEWVGFENVEISTTGLQKVFARLA